MARGKTPPVDIPDDEEALFDDHDASREDGVFVGDEAHRAAIAAILAAYVAGADPADDPDGPLALEEAPPGLLAVVLDFSSAVRSPPLPWTGPVGEA